MTEIKAAEAAKTVAAVTKAAAETEAAEEAKTAAKEAKTAAAEAKAAAETKMAAAEATAAAEAKAAAEFTEAGGGTGSPGMTALGSGSAAAIELMLRGRLQGPGHSGASGIANPAANLPTACRIAVVLAFLRDPEEGLPLRGVLQLPSIRRLRCRRRRQ